MTGMSATDILDRIEYWHSKCALVREVAVTDASVQDTSEAWWERHRARNYLQDTTDPYPKQVWTRRIDGLMFDGGGTRTAIEVKVSRADFKRESDAKRDPWRRITNRFVYATPVGLLDVSDIPAGCGLWEVDGDTVQIVKRARIVKDPEPIPAQVVVALAYRVAKKGNKP